MAAEGKSSAAFCFNYMDGSVFLKYFLTFTGTGRIIYD